MVSSFFSFEMGLCTLCHCALEARKFLFDFIRAHSQEFALNLRGDSGLRLFLMELLRLGNS